MVVWCQEETPLASDLLKHKSARGILGIVTQVDNRLSRCFDNDLHSQGCGG